MDWLISNLWLIPGLPLAAAGALALTREGKRRRGAGLAISAMAGACFLSFLAVLTTLRPGPGEEPVRWVSNFNWLQMGSSWLQLGWVLDPLAACMLLMVSFIGLLIFIYSTAYMEHDPHFTRFFCFLSLFSAAMLGLVISNSLLLFFICWELVGLASYLLIGFWFHKPSAAAAAKKAFITTRIGDLGLFLGMLWIFSNTGTLLFYDYGRGCLEAAGLATLLPPGALGGLGAATAISLLIFCGTIGKSGQVPLHVWLPDAMEGPTPVSALIHAATMVAAGVFLLARVYPILDIDPGHVLNSSAALEVIAWVGSLTAVFAACIAVAQTDIKRILAYSTVSQLGYMVMALGVGGYVPAMFHLITHAFFKALLFLGAGSVIHACHEEQDIRRMGGLRELMPKTFLTYAIGMMALAGFPLFFSGFWSKDEILHSAWAWPESKGPFLLGLSGTFLTAFYMTRQILYVFWGSYRGTTAQTVPQPNGKKKKRHVAAPVAQESPRWMVLPLQVLAVGAVVLGFLGTPAWPWFHGYLTGHHAAFQPGHLFDPSVLGIMGLSTVIVALGVGLAWLLYGRKPIPSATHPDPLESLQPEAYGLLREKFRVDEIYEATVLRGVRYLSVFAAWADQTLWQGGVRVARNLALAFSWLSRSIDEWVVNRGFDAGCGGVKRSGGWMSLLENGQIHFYLQWLAVGLIGLALMMFWGWRS